jgi:hypothetical protein
LALKALCKALQKETVIVAHLVESTSCALVGVLAVALLETFSAMTEQVQVVVLSVRLVTELGTQQVQR